MKNVKKAISLIMTIIMVVALLVVPTTSVSAAETTKKSGKPLTNWLRKKVTLTAYSNRGCRVICHKVTISEEV